MPVSGWFADSPVFLYDTEALVELLQKTIEQKALMWEKDCRGGIGAIQLIPKGNNCEIRYRYDWHRAIPERYKYTKEGTRFPLNEFAFELCSGDYGRAVCNGRFVDIDTGIWYYKMDIVNVMISQENDVPLDCFLVNAPTHYYRQIAKLF